jgi:hypothetical protein
MTDDDDDIQYSYADLQAAVLAEREACAEIARFARMHAIADAIMRRGGLE